MKKNKLSKEEDIRYSKISRAENLLLGADLLIYTVKGIIWLITTPIKWMIKKVRK